MEGIWLVLFVSMWIVVILELFLILALARQVGTLLQTRPTGARMMNDGPPIGDTAPPLEASDLFGKPVALGTHRGVRTLLLFISLGCDTCGELMPKLKTLWRSEKDDLDIVLVAPGADPGRSHEFVRKHNVTQIPFLTSGALGERFQVGVVPYGIMVDNQGKVRAKGLVNSGPHLESLLTGEEMGHPSFESYTNGRDAETQEAGVIGH